MIEINEKLPFEKRLETVKVVNKFDSEEQEKYQEPKLAELLKRGILIIDKPSGPTSHQTVDYLKRILKIKKAGHSGTLDPGVTGVLPVALQNATRITNALLTAGKEYVCLMHIHGDVTDEELEIVLKKFRGEIKQLPPKKSAVKRQVRKRNIYYLKIIERQDRDILFVTGTQAGTYIRKLVHDIGVQLKCGAHMVELRRTKAGPYKESQARTLQEISDAFYYYNKGDESHLRKIILPIETGISHLKKIWVDDSTINSLCHGAFLKVPGIVKLDEDICKKDPVVLLSMKGELILVGEAMLNTKEMLSQDKGLAVKTIQVFMDKDKYQKITD